ncbi:MAG: ABC transporter ATP-binding protein [Oscillospiraceae bacterium]|nr:ABC transporter ATP-binding protein [Oscillospiraceae bacterium]
MICVNNLAFSYSKIPFIENTSFEVKSGEIFGFLGPSGAGKSTLQKILTGLLPGFSGEVSVNDTNIGRHNGSFYESIGVAFEFPSLYEKLTATENLRFFASLYPTHRDIPSLLGMVGLERDANKKVSDFSKGMKTRINFIKALMHNPRILFLDEPTSGLDPSNARVVKDIVLEEKAKGTTIILTTHNMYDATELCDRVAFIVDGKIKALDTPRNLIMSRGASTVRYTFVDNGTEEYREIPMDRTSTDETLADLVRHDRLMSIHSGEPTLNDVFVEITGRHLV